MQQTQNEPKIPVGTEFLNLIGEHERSTEANFEEWLLTAGVKAPQALESLGTALSCLDRIASCLWGCDGGDHLQKRLLGRVTSNARASLLLLKTGYYDEGLSLIRQIGETVNLLFLFMGCSESLDEWTVADEEDRRRNFSAVKVRIRLAELASHIPMNEDLYHRLSGLSVHANPNITPQGHNPLMVPTMGGYFQAVGALKTLNHLAKLVALVLLFGSTLLQQPADKISVLRAGRKLAESIGGIDIRTAEEYLESVRDTAEFKRVSDAVRRNQIAHREAFTQHRSLSGAEDSVIKKNS